MVGRYRAAIDDPHKGAFAILALFGKDKAPTPDEYAGARLLSDAARALTRK